MSTRTVGGGLAFQVQQKVPCDGVISFGNRLYMDRRLKLREKFANSVNQIFKLEVWSVDFSNYPIVREVNTWVEEKTHGLIKDYLKPDEVDDLSRIVLVNTLYMKSKWRNSLQNKPGGIEFFVSPTKVVNVDAMRTPAAETFGYYENDEIKALEMELDIQGAAVVFVLPKRKNLAEIRATMSDQLPSIFRGLRNKLLKVTIPTFKIEQEIPMNPALESNGIHAFIYGFTLPHVLEAGNTTFRVNIKQKVSIEITCGGIEAAAVTSGVALLSDPFYDDDTQEFISDRPFLFYVTRKAHAGRAILFIGQFTSQ